MGGEYKMITGNGKILIMDDEKMIREVAGEMLAYFGYEVQFAKDGAEALEKYAHAMKSGISFDAVIMDLTVPGGMGGIETIKKLIEIDPDVKAIVSSGYSNDPVMSDFRDYSFAGIVMKPYQVAELNEQVRNVCKGDICNSFSAHARVQQTVSLLLNLEESVIDGDRCSL
jgi:CheY-like chemotaxis protein